MRVIVAAALLTVASGLNAQARPVVRGDVFLPDSATPASRVIIEVIDASGAVVGRSLTTERGAFSIALTATGRYTARALRIGFRPTPVPAFDVRAESPAVLRIVLGGQAVQLATVKVSADEACRVRADSGKLVAQAWEETRKALTSASLATPDARSSSRAVLFRSVRDDDGGKVLWQEFSTADNLPTRPFSSASAHVFATSGYSSPDSSGTRWFFAPDADALISDEFAASHCFRLVAPPAERPEWLGVAFRPARERDGVVEIAGTFWVIRSTAELRLLEYRYTNVPRAMERAGVGGRIEYLHLASGDWLLNRWQIRAATDLGTGEAANRFVSRAAAAPTRLNLSVTGGETSSVDRGGSELYRGQGQSWDAIVALNPGEMGGAGATVEFIGTGYFAVADSTGRLHLDHVLTGSHVLAFSTTVMRTLGLPAVRRTVRIGSGGSVDTLRPPDDASVLRERCGKDAEARERAVLYGSALDRMGTPLASAELTLRWLTPSDRLAGERIERQVGYPLKTDELGRWSVCALPRGGDALVSLDRGGRPSVELLRLAIPLNARLVPATAAMPREP